ncbi:glycine cleavage system transcriptional repressor [Shewanella avicenniae]|uniref:Glycine cleavage system transcriptional repressor n=1 Tax=Shewanella avicenniae TaxID=2814294 RepID=A0ABX7QXC9_9GAMM|nr:ACT domain-containing protein [Shewanella avicenniae]QSX35301.1 glycine cleavage system transcriptional repressor [Shewanella avicenniae]
MTNYLVVTAMGTDRPGLVAKLAKLATDCDCDIVDSRMAGFGNEFTMIMMMSGSWPAITQLETQLPQLSVELELLTVMKRTSKHTPLNYGSRLEVTLQGQDQRGTLRKITEFIADRSLDLGAVRSFATDENQNTQHLFLAINIPENVDLEELEQSIATVAGNLNLTCSIKRMLGVQVPDIS